MLERKVHHPNDITVKYLTEVMPEKLHHYLGLPGKFVCNYPTRVIKRDGSEREMDWLIFAREDNAIIFEKILINVEFQSSYVGLKKIKVIAEYRDYSKTYYDFPVLSVIVITEGFDSSVLEYSRVSSDIIKPVYIHLNLREVNERLKNIEDKINNQKQLSDDEALDMVFLPMFASNNNAKSVTEKLAKLFHKDKSLTGAFRNDIGFSLSLMVKKHFDFSDKGKELLKMLEGEIENTKLRDVVEFEVDFILRSHEKELAEKDEIISEQGKALNNKDEVIFEQGKALKNKDEVISEKDNEITMLKAKIEELTLGK